MTSLAYLTDVHLSNVYLLLKFSTCKTLVVDQLLVDGKLLVVNKHWVDINLFSVGRH